MKRLDEIVVGAELHRFHRAIHHVVGAHHHDDACGIGSLDLAQNLTPSIPGSTMSSNTRSGFSSSKICSASSPEAAVRISKPSAVSPRLMVHSVKSSSSTIKTE